MTFRSGVRVVHQDRPEWGVGVVLTALRIGGGSDGASRLRVRFDRAGLKTLCVPPAAIHVENSSTPGDHGDRLSGLDDDDATKIMIALPEAVRDPFASIKARFSATLALYRFTPSGGSLIDWATAQSGLADPLTRFTRQSLEEMFDHFVRLRDDHLKELLRQSGKERLTLLAQTASSAPPAGRTALRRLIGA